VGGVLVSAGHTVLWASAGRSEATGARARAHGLEDAGTLAALATRADVVLSICPPSAAREVARPFARFGGIFVDANSIAPGTSQAIGAGVGRFVDGGIVGPPPATHGTTRLFVSGAEAGTVAALFDGTEVEARVVSEQPGDASAVKCGYAAWTKGTAALVLAIRAFARAGEVEAELLGEWERSQPGLVERSAGAAQSADAKGWRWIGEMEEIAAAFEAAGLPGGFHRAAAEVYRSFPLDGDPASA